MSFVQIYDQYTTVGDTYQGTLSRVECSFTIPLPEQVGTGLIAERFVQELEAGLAEKNLVLLRTQILEDSAPTWQTDYQVVFWAAAVSPIPAAIIPFIPYIILGAAAVAAGIAILLVTNLTIGKITNLVWGPPGTFNPLGIPWGAIAIGSVILGGIYLVTKGDKKK